jgi:hypothetical protein
MEKLEYLLSTFLLVMACIAFYHLVVSPRVPAAQQFIGF